MLKKIQAPMVLETKHVLRRKDLVELFDTTPDLAGNDIDVARYIRDGEELDVQVFWREVPENETPSPDQDNGKAPRREELCPVSFARFRDDFLVKKKTAFRWDYLERRWIRADSSHAFPGQVYLVPADQGGYTAETGWDAKCKKKVDVIRSDTTGNALESNESESSEGDWQTIEEHTNDVCKTLAEIIRFIGIPDTWRSALEWAARWHDRGKAHAAFQALIRLEALHKANEHRVLKDQPAAKAPKNCWRKDWSRLGRDPDDKRRKHFRHELASALAVLQTSKLPFPKDLQDLIAYLAGAHHGKVRLSIRSLPGEQPHGQDTRFARGVWEDDNLPATVLGDGIHAPDVKLTLEPMELGLSEDGKPSWAERMLALRDAADLGPFRLAYMEALLRAADMRASAAHAAAGVGDKGKDGQDA